GHSTSPNRYVPNSFFSTPADSTATSAPGAVVIAIPYSPSSRGADATATVRVTSPRVRRCSSVGRNVRSLTAWGRWGSHRCPLTMTSGSVPRKKGRCRSMSRTTASCRSRRTSSWAIVTVVPFGSSVLASCSIHRTGISAPPDRSMSLRSRATVLRRPRRTVRTSRCRAMPKAAAFPVPNLPRPRFPALRSGFSPCMVKNRWRSSTSIPRPLSTMVTWPRFWSSWTRTCGCTPASTYSMLFTTYSQMAASGVRKSWAVWSRSRATCVRTLISSATATTRFRPPCRRGPATDSEHDVGHGTDERPHGRVRAQELDDPLHLQMHIAFRGLGVDAEDPLRLPELYGKSRRPRLPHHEPPDPPPLQRALAGLHPLLVASGRAPGHEAAADGPAASLHPPHALEGERPACPDGALYEPSIGWLRGIVEGHAHPVQVYLVGVLAPGKCRRRELTGSHGDVLGVHPHPGAAQIGERQDRDVRLAHSPTVSHGRHAPLRRFRPPGSPARRPSRTRG